jgi:hypothetical protein
MSLVIFLKKDGAIEATADDTAVILEENGKLKAKKNDFQKIYPLNSKSIIGYASQTPVNEQDLSGMTDSLAFFTKDMNTISEIANEFCEFIRGTDEPRPDQILIGGVDPEPRIYKLDRCHKNFKPEEVLYDYCFIGWIHVATCEYPNHKDKSVDIAVDLIQLTCDHPMISGLIGGKLRRYVVANSGIEPIPMEVEIKQTKVK